MMEGSARRQWRGLDLSLVTPLVGLITAVPVVALFSVGLLLDSTRGAIAMAVGANLVAMVSLVGAPRLSLRLAIADALTSGLAVFVGIATSTVPWLHTALLVPLCFGAGMLALFGQTQAVVGTQAIIAYVVIGHFPGSSLVALHLSLFVVFGALGEVLALLVLRLPPSLRHQRRRLASAVAAVAQFAASDPHRPAIFVLATLDGAEDSISAPSLFGRTDVTDFRAILDQARRLQLELTTLAGLRVRLLTNDPGGHITNVEACLHALTHAIEQIGAVLRRTSRAPTWTSAAAQFQASLQHLQAQSGSGDASAQVLVRQCVASLEAAGGQLRSMGHLVDGLHRGEVQSSWHPRESLRYGFDGPNLAATLSRVREHFRSNSPVLRHALRLAVAVPASALVGNVLALPRSYWLPFAVAVILKPDFSSLIKGGRGRLIGTLVGAALAATAISGLHPRMELTTLLVALCAWATYSTWSASFSVATSFSTAMILILLNSTIANSVATAFDRLVEFTLGALIAVAAYVVWPTSPRAEVRRAYCVLFSALHDYLAVVSSAVEAKPAPATRTAYYSRVSRLAWAQTEGAVGRSVSEPASTRVDPSEGRGLLAATLRIFRTTHALRIEAERGATVGPILELDELLAGCLTALVQLSQWFDTEDRGPRSDLRLLYRSAERTLTAIGAPASIAVHLDELVNAINTAAHLAGLATHTPSPP